VDENRFDDLTKALGSPTNRRLTLSAFLGGALGVLGFTDAEAAESGRCQPRCGECEQCNRGSCRKTRHRQKRCNPGNCQPLTGPACGIPSGGTCQNGICACPSGQDLCGGVCRAFCPAGQMRVPSTCGCCRVAGVGPCNVGADVTCCSGRCAARTVAPFSACT
jgi:hypothetical protein